MALEVVPCTDCGWSSSAWWAAAAAPRADALILPIVERFRVPPPFTLSLSTVRGAAVVTDPPGRSDPRLHRDEPVRDLDLERGLSPSRGVVRPYRRAVPHFGPGADRDADVHHQPAAAVELVLRTPGFGTAPWGEASAEALDNLAAEVLVLLWPPSTD